MFGDLILLPGRHEDEFGFFVVNSAQCELVYEPLSMYWTGVCILLTSYFQDDYIAHLVIIGLIIVISDMPVT